MGEFPGVYRAQFLSSDALGNVQCAVPSVIGNAPVTALSAGMSVVDALTPGSLGWVVFEGGDPSLPVWVGAARLTVDTRVVTATVTSVAPFTITYANGSTYVSPDVSYRYWPTLNDTVRVELGGLKPFVLDLIGSPWHDDHLRNPIVKTAGGNENRGNAIIVARYRIIDGFCDWHGHYVLGSSTTWPGGALSLVLPVNPENNYFVAASTSIPGGFVRAFNGTSYFYANVEYAGGAVLGTVQLISQNVSTTPAVPWSINTVPVAFTTNYILSWNLRYPVV